MREDMKYVVIEKGRRGGGGKENRTRPRRKGEEWEGFPKHEGMRRPYGYNTKDQTDRLGPLRGYLRKQVGKPWDKVYADICRNLDFRSVLGFHIQSHLLGEVDGLTRQVEIRDGVPYTRFGHSESSFFRVSRLYVHPRTGLLRDARSTVKRRPRAMPGPPAPRTGTAR